MKLIAGLLLSLSLLFSQTYYSYSPNTYYTLTKTTSLEAGAEKITLQLGPNNSAKFRLIAGYVSCSAACTVTMSIQGTAATTTAQTPVQLNPTTGAKPSAIRAFNTSNAGAGTTVATFALQANTDKVFDLSTMQVQGTAGNNFSIGTNSITGNVTINLLWVEL